MGWIQKKVNLLKKLALISGSFFHFRGGISSCCGWCVVVPSPSPVLDFCCFLNRPILLDDDDELI